MATVYEIRFGTGAWQTAAALGIENVELTLRNAGTDALAFEVVGDCLAASLAAYNATVRLRRTVDAGTPECLFVGTLVTLPRIASPEGESMQYLAVGAGYALEKLTYEQQWQIMRASDGELVTIAKPRVVLGQADDGTRLATGAQIRAIVEFARIRGKLVALGTVDDGMVMPYDERENLKCADAVAACLRWHPDWSAWWDYNHVDPDTGEYTPAFNARSAANLTAVAVPVQAVDMESLELTPRYDLQLPGVRVVYELTHEKDGKSYPTTVVDVAGDANNPDALTFMFDLVGSQIGTLEQAVETAEHTTVDGSVSTDAIKTRAWWYARLPYLGVDNTNASDAYFRLEDSSGNSVVDGSSDADVSRSGTLGLPRYLVKGAIQPWMDVQCEEETVSAKCIYADMVAVPSLVVGGKCYWRHKPISAKVLSTDAQTGVYRRSVVYRQSELVPSGVALSIYNAASRLHFDGRVSLVAVEPSLSVGPWSCISLSGGDASWASMQALVQDMVVHVDTGTAKLILGPCKRLGADDHVALFKAARARRFSTSCLARADASETGPTATVPEQPARNDAADGGIGELQSLMVRTVYSDRTHTIGLWPHLIAPYYGDQTNSQTISPREYYVVQRVGVNFYLQPVIIMGGLVPSSNTSRYRLVQTTGYVYAP